MLSELVQGILAVKTFCWEDPIEKNIQALRLKEHKYLRKMYLVRSFNFALCSSIVPIMTFITFTYLWSQKQKFDLPTAIYLISLITAPKMEISSALTQGCLTVYYISILILSKKI